MADINTKQTLICDYFADWINLYKKGAVRNVTFDKYQNTLGWLKRIAPDLKVCELDRKTYQRIINKYAEHHEVQSVKDFNTQIRACVLDLIDEGLIERDPTRKVILKGKTPREKKPKYLNQFELHMLLSSLNLGKEPNWEWLILLIAKTGMRFSEAIAINPDDFDFKNQFVSVSKTWNYKEGGGYAPTKNKSSVRKIRLDWQSITQFSSLIDGLPKNKPIFVEEGKRIYNSTANDVLERYCKTLNLPTISIHGLRHTHASLLLYAGASIASVARRLGHSNMATTQKTYLHIIQELENQDVDLMMRALSNV